MRFLAPFEDFTTPPLPDSVDAYEAYRRLAIEFIEARNRRIDAYAAGCSVLDRRWPHAGQRRPGKPPVRS